MASYHGPKAKPQRRFGELLVPRPKYSRILEERAYPPGEHGREKSFRAGRRSNYALQLEEKQKLSFIYNLRERQMRNYYKKAALMPGTDRYQFARPVGTTTGQCRLPFRLGGDDLVSASDCRAQAYSDQRQPRQFALVSGAAGVMKSK